MASELCAFPLALGLVVGADHEHGLGGFLVPEDSRSLEAEVVYIANRTFHRAAADGQAQAAGPGVGEAAAVAPEVVAIPLQRFGARVALQDFCISPRTVSIIPARTRHGQGFSRKGIIHNWHRWLRIKGLSEITAIYIGHF